MNILTLTGMKYIWHLFLDGVNYVSAKVSDYPKITLLLVLSYVLIRQ